MSWFIALLFLAGSSNLYANWDDIRFEHLSVEDGLSQRFVLEVVVDCQGYLWVATEDGLNRYDGYDFKVFRNDPDDPTSLGGNILRQALESHAYGEHKLWVCTVGGGLACLDLTTELFTNYQHDPTDSTSISSNSVWIVEETYFDGKPEIWVGTLNPKNLDRFDHTTGKFKRYRMPSTVTDLFYDSAGRLWIGTGNTGIGLYRPDLDDFEFFEHDPDDSTTIGSQGTWDMTEDHAGNLWVGGMQPLDRMIPPAKPDDRPVFIHHANDPKDSYSFAGAVEYLFEDSKRRLWVSTFGNGQDLFDRETGRFHHFLMNPDNPHSIGGNSIYSVAEDHSGNIWFGHWNGVSKLDDQKIRFHRYEFSGHGPTGLAEKWISSIIVTKDAGEEFFWLGAVGKGLCRFNRTTGEAKWYEHDPMNSNSLADPVVLGLALPEPTRLVILTWGGLSVFDIRTETFETHYLYPDPNDDYYEELMITGHMGPSGRVWIGAFDHIGAYDFRTNQLESIIRVRAYAVLETIHKGKNYLWGGSFNNGLLRLDLETREEVWYLHDPENPYSLADNMIEALFSTRYLGKDVLWIGTMKGLDRYDYETETFTHYTMSDGLPHNHITCINEDLNGDLWFTSKVGLTRFDPVEETFKTFWKEDGLPGDGYDFESIYIDTSGEVFVGGDKGLVSFFPDSIKENPRPPNVVLTDFKLFYEPVPVVPESEELDDGVFSIPKSIGYLDELNLTYRENIFSLSFSALDFRSPRKNQYAYFLEGFEEDWNYVDAFNREVTYTNQDPGNYIFRVKASNNDADWNEAGVSLSITISPPWWETKFAYFGYLLVVATILVYLYRRQMYRTRMQHQLEMKELEANKYREVDEIKTRFFTNISHEFRTPLTLILGPVEKLLSRWEDPDSRRQLGVMKRNAVRLNRLVSQLLDLSKIEANKHSIRVSRHNLIPLLKALVLTFSSLAERKGVTLEFESDHEELFAYVERESLSKIINNLLSNAFKFSDAGAEIRVQVQTRDPCTFSEEGCVAIIVSDTGIGIPPETLEHVFDRFYQVDGSQTREREGTGIGLALTKELVELHHGKISVESETGKGTCFTVRIPLGTSHLQEAEILDLVDEQEEFDKLLDPHHEISDEDSRDDIPLEDDEMARVLIVEDNVDVRNFIRTSLEQPFQFYEAGDGVEGLEEAYRTIPDLIITDIMMPRMDGVELCTQLKQDERTSHIPIIMLTARADMESKLEGLEVGADAYITKPFESRELEKRILNLIEVRESLREHFRQELNPLPASMSATVVDEKFLQRCFDTVLEHITDNDFGVDQLARELHMSRQHLNRKLKALSGDTPRRFIRSVRLKRAARLLQQNPTSILEIAYQVGFSNPSYFSECFHHEFGVTPKEYISNRTFDSS